MARLKDTFYVPQNYSSELNILETEKAIKDIKDRFEKELAKELNLKRVSAPLFVLKSSGLNDNLNGVERPVEFDLLGVDGKVVEIVQSLAKWKREALKDYHIREGEGLYTDMNAIRRDEMLDNLHSIYVDQWDWEKNISKKMRNVNKLKENVDSVYKALMNTYAFVNENILNIKNKLPDKIFYITTQELEDKYPSLSPKEREDKIAREKKAVFIMKIGHVLKSGTKHDGRAPDYDDWNLNGDIVLYNRILDCAFEISSMGIRVDSKTLKKQLEISGCIKRLSLPFHDSLYNNKLPQSVGGGIGQSRLCMFLLDKAHVGEVQSSVWPIEMIKKCKAANINLL